MTAVLASNAVTGGALITGAVGCVLAAIAIYALYGRRS